MQMFAAEKTRRIFLKDMGIAMFGLGARRPRGSPGRALRNRRVRARKCWWRFSSAAPSTA